MRALAVGHIRKPLPVAAVQPSRTHSLQVGRLESLGPGATNSAGRRRIAQEQEKLWARERRADAMAARQGFNLVRTGFAKLD